MCPVVLHEAGWPARTTRASSAGERSSEPAVPFPWLVMCSEWCSHFRLRHRHVPRQFSSSRALGYEHFLRSKCPVAPIHRNKNEERERVSEFYRDRETRLDFFSAPKIPQRRDKVVKTVRVCVSSRARCGLLSDRRRRAAPRSEVTVTNSRIHGLPWENFNRGWGVMLSPHASLGACHLPSTFRATVTV